MPPGVVSLRTLGDWDKEIGVGLNSALAVSMDVFGYNGETACRQAVWFMTESATKMTTVAPEKRPVEANPQFENLLKKSQYKALRMKGMKPEELGRRFMKFRALRYRPGNKTDYRYANQPSRIEKIGRRGLAQRSWMWGYGRGKPIPGVTDLYSVSGARAGRGMMSTDMTGGYILVNRLDYIQAALPDGWEGEVERLAANRIMGRFKSQLEADWRRRMGMPKKRVTGSYRPTNAELAAYFTAAPGR